jgi:hypothetical protein
VLSKPRARHTETVKVQAGKPKDADINHTKLLGTEFLMSSYWRGEVYCSFGSEEPDIVEKLLGEMYSRWWQ